MQPSDSHTHPREAALSKAKYERSAFGLALRFIVAALAVTLTLGTLWGVIGLTRIAARHSYQGPDYASIQAHGHAQMFGWIGLFIMGVGYYMIPRFRSARVPSIPLAASSLYLMLGGILARALGQPRADIPAWGWLMTAGAAAELVAVGVFAWLTVGSWRGRAFPRRFQEKWILASLTWLIVVSALNLPLCAWMTVNGWTVVPEPANGILMNLTLYGFIGSMIGGMALRMLPGLMWLGAPRQTLADVAFVAYQSGVITRVMNPPIAASSLALLVAAVLLVLSLRVLEPSRPAPHERTGDPAWMWYVRLAFGWLLVSSAMVAGADIYHAVTGRPAPHEFMGAYRHAITVGFVTTLTMGVASRLVPLIGHTELHSTRMMRWSFWLIAIGNITRVTAQITTLSGSAVAFAIAGSSGYLELASLGVFAVNMLLTLRRAAANLRAQEQAMDGRPEDAAFVSLDTLQTGARLR